MEQEVLEELIEKNPEYPTFLLYLLLREEYEVLQTLYDYKIYDKLLGNFLLACDFDPLNIRYSARVIATRPFITKEIVHDNLSRKNAIKFVQEPYSDKFGIEEIYIHEQGNEFIKKYEQHKANKKSR